MDEKSKVFQNSESHSYVRHFIKIFEDLTSFESMAIEEEIRRGSVFLEVKLSELAQVLRVALTGRTVSPSLFEIMFILGREETLNV